MRRSKTAGIAPSPRTLATLAGLAGGLVLALTLSVGMLSAPADAAVLRGDMAMRDMAPPAAIEVGWDRRYHRGHRHWRHGPPRGKAYGHYRHRPGYHRGYRPRSGVSIGFAWSSGPRWVAPPPVYAAPPIYVAPPVYVPPPAYVPPRTVYTAPPAPAPYCREYQGDAIIDGTNQRFYGRACLQPDGSWRIVN